MSALRDLVESGARPIVTGEAPTVDGGDPATFARRIAEMADYVDAMNATDNPTARAHASSLAVALAIASAGVEPVVQVVCRDRNRLALQADIVGAALHGIENICCMTGDDVTAGDEPEARRVFDLDGPQLVNVATGLTSGRYLSGRPIDPAPRLFVGAVENAATPSPESRPDRAAKKARAGARFLQLQICYQHSRLEDFVGRLHDTGLTERVAILPTIALLRSGRSLRFIDERVPGVSVPAATISGVESSSDQHEAAYALALDQARHALSLAGVRGIHITDFRHDGALSRLCKDLGIPTREERRAHAHGASVAF